MNRNEAIEKIDFIKETIEDAKIHYQGIWLMCFLLGGLYLMQFVTEIGRASCRERVYSYV